MQRTEPALNSCPTPELKHRLNIACATAIKAGKLIRNRFHQPHDIRMKGVINLVTETDLAAEALIIETLAKATPDIPIMAEESAQSLAVRSEPCYWVVDPLDGTTNFAHGVPHFAVSIALLEEGKPKVGAVYHPMLDELYCASLGGGAWLNQQQVHVTRTDALINALVATGFPYDIDQTLTEVISQLQRVLPAVRDIRRAGAAALDLAFVACGRLDGFYEINLQPWDTAAGWLLVEEAGGTLSDFMGLPYSPFVPQTLATNGLLHPALLHLIQ
ncbi:inositol monophosphatase family protein [uncultured Vibrio sp.]|uniref:inositol monophosphatase family protein n=1 Tax=uncultured Vibrio sp. TaxID=114054 RepID=UPI002AA78419|nr:inositol monophosphatase family protein [uncultured Vibrio sp.]